MSDLSQPQAPVLIDKLQWRYAAKKYGPRPRPCRKRRWTASSRPPAWRPPPAACSHSRSSWVTSKAVREQIQPIAWNQAQITDGSHLLVFAAWDNYTAERINHMFDLTNEQRGFTNEGWENYRQMLLGKTYPGARRRGELQPRRPPSLHRPGRRADRRRI